LQKYIAAKMQLEYKFVSEYVGTFNMNWQLIN